MRNVKRGSPEHVESAKWCEEQSMVLMRVLGKIEASAPSEEARAAWKCALAHAFVEDAAKSQGAHAEFWAALLREVNKYMRLIKSVNEGALVMKGSRVLLSKGGEA